MPRRIIKPRAVGFVHLGGSETRPYAKQEAGNRPLKPVQSCEESGSARFQTRPSARRDSPHMPPHPNPCMCRGGYVPRTLGMSEGIARAGTDRLARGPLRARGRAGSSRPVALAQSPNSCRGRSREPVSARQGARSARVEGTQWLPDRICISASMSLAITWTWPSTRPGPRGGWPTPPPAMPPCASGCRGSRIAGSCWRPVAAMNRRWRMSWPPPACPWWWSTRARCATSPAPAASSPRPTRWMPRCSRTSPPPSSPPCARAPRRPRATWPRWSPGAASSRTCASPSSSHSCRQSGQCAILQACERAGNGFSGRPPPHHRLALALWEVRFTE